MKKMIIAYKNVILSEELRLEYNNKVKFIPYKEEVTADGLLLKAGTEKNHNTEDFKMLYCIADGIVTKRIIEDLLEAFKGHENR